MNNSFIKELYNLLTKNAIDKLRAVKAGSSFCIYTKQVTEILNLKSKPAEWAKFLALLEANDFELRINEEASRKRNKDTGEWQNYEPCVFMSPSTFAKSSDDLLDQIASVTSS